MAGGSGDFATIPGGSEIPGDEIEGEVNQSFPGAPAGSIDQAFSFVGSGDPLSIDFSSSTLNTLILAFDRGASSITGGSGNDLIGSGKGGDQIDGGGGDDFLRTQGGADSISGGSGNDLLNGGSGNDFAELGAGDDTFFGQTGDDTAYGEAGDDALGGRLGDDWLDGGAGDDTLRGGDGDDTLEGGAGDDRLGGEAGADEYIFKSGFGDDFIFGFTTGTNNDVLVIEANINGLPIAAPEDLLSYISAAPGGGVLITLGSDTIRISGLTESELESNLAKYVQITGF